MDNIDLSVKDLDLSGLDVGANEITQQLNQLDRRISDISQLDID